MAPTTSSLSVDDGSLFGSHSRSHLGLARIPCWREPELLELPRPDPGALEGNLRDLRRINRLPGGTRLTLRGLERLARAWTPETRVTLLDVGTGGGDIPAEVVRWGARRRVTIHCLAVDISLPVLRHAAAAFDGFLVVADGTRLPLRDQSVDVGICSMVLHHVDPHGAVDLLAEMRRIARQGIVVNDLIRTRSGLLAAWAFTRLATRNPFTRHDAPVSVHRAYTEAEMTQLAALAGLRSPVFDRCAGYRVAMTCRTRP